MIELEPDTGSVFSFTLSMLLLGLLLAIAAAHEAFLLTAFTAATLLLALAVRAWGSIALLRLDITLSVAQDRLFPGDTLKLATLISNRKPLPVWVRLELPRPDAFEPLGDGTESGSVEERIEGETGLLPFEKVQGSWHFRALRRGVFRLGPATLSAGDILGLARKEKTFPFPQDIVVFPRLVPIHTLELPFRDYFGIHPSRGIIEDPAWYEGTREYSGNRPARNIHWKASARLGVLQEKIFEPTSHKKVFFLLVGRGFEIAEGRAGFESALEITASLIASLAEEGASFAVATDRLVRGFPAVLPLGRGPEHLGSTLELLARCRLDAGQAILPLLANVGTSGAGYVVVARAPDDGTRKFLSLPASRRDRVLFLFSEPAPADGIMGCPAISFGSVLDGGSSGANAGSAAGTAQGNAEDPP
jgi:uncharacterized protein (DUF58 family)